MPASNAHSLRLSAPIVVVAKEEGREEGEEVGGEAIVDGLIADVPTLAWWTILETPFFDEIWSYLIYLFK